MKTALRSKVDHGFTNSLAVQLLHLQLQLSVHSPHTVRTAFSFFANNFSFISVVLLVYFSVFCFLFFTFALHISCTPGCLAKIQVDCGLPSTPPLISQRLFIRNTVSAAHCILFNFLRVDIKVCKIVW